MLFGRSEFMPEGAFVFLLTGLWVPNLLAMMAVYAPIEQSLHLEAQIQALQNR